MAQPRIQLHELLKTTLGSDHVYFQPPADTKMQYPAIRYERDDSNTSHANNKLYRHDKRYKVTVIDPNPDSAIPDAVEALEKCRFDRFYTAANLNHFVFQIHF